MAKASVLQARPRTDTPDEPPDEPSLSEQEQFLYDHHLDNLFGSGKVLSPSGDISTVLQTPVEGPGGRYYNIPLVWGGQVLTTPEATAKAADAGWQKWPSYKTPDEADLRYEVMHGLMEKDVANYLKLRGRP